MRLFRDAFSLPDSARGAVIALGNFDGVHLGHRAIIADAARIAKERGRKLAVMTFEPHPREILAPGAPKIRIYPFRQKARLLAGLGVEQLFALHFTPAFSQLSAEEFITRVLVEGAGAAHVVSGYNFFFGKGRAGDKDLLAGDGRFGFSAHAPVVCESGEPVSSSRIRAHLKDGDIAGAELQLGAPYLLSGHVRGGQKRGRELGTPTANLAFHGLALPRFGVYTVEAEVEGKTHRGVANLGVKPTMGTHAPLLETHLLDFSGDLYGKRLTVRLKDFLREEKKFDNLAQLKEQITHDMRIARERLS